MKTVKIFFCGMMLLTGLTACKKQTNELETVTVEYNEPAANTIAENATIEEINFTIDGMTCAVGCAAKIEKSLANMPGVAKAKVDFETKMAIVSYDAGQVTTELLAKRVAKTGSQYKAVKFTTDGITQ